MTPKAHNKRLRMAQLRRMRAHAIRQQCCDGKRED